MITASPEFQAPTRFGSKTVFSLVAKPCTEARSPHPVKRTAAKTGVIHNARIVRLLSQENSAAIGSGFHPFAKFLLYSVRKATIGSTAAARQAGIVDARNAAKPSSDVASASMIGSHG